ncbi:MAG: hypothetical protein AB8G05_09645 [Oligoflexales bacterium]
MKKKISDRHRKRQLRQRKAQETRRKSQEAIKIREAEKTRAERLEILDYESEIASNLKNYQENNVQKVFGIQSESEESFEVYYDNNIMKEMPKVLLFDFIKSICRSFRMYKKKCIMLLMDEPDLEVAKSKVQLEFMKSKDQIIVRGHVDNDFDEVDEVCEILWTCLNDTVARYLPELKEKFRTPRDAIKNIDACEWNQIQMISTRTLSKVQNNDLHA